MCQTKGMLNGKCNRTICANIQATYFNHSTEKYYCKSCAMLLNNVNHKEALEMFGHNLCTLVEFDVEEIKASQK